MPAWGTRPRLPAPHRPCPEGALHRTDTGVLLGDYAAPLQGRPNLPCHTQGVAAPCPGLICRRAFSAQRNHYCRWRRRWTSRSTRSRSRPGRSPGPPSARQEPGFGWPPQTPKVDDSPWRSKAKIRDALAQLEYLLADQDTGKIVFIGTRSTHDDPTTDLLLKRPRPTKRPGRPATVLTRVVRWANCVRAGGVLSRTDGRWTAHPARPSEHTRV